jgi:putative hemolysin
MTLLISHVTPRFYWMTLVSLGGLATLTALDHLSSLVTRRYPNAILHFTAPALSAISIIAGKRPNKEHEATPISRLNTHKSTRKESDLLEDHDLILTEEARATMDTRERSMVRSILHLDKSTVQMVMVPRVDVVAVEINESLDSVARRMGEVGHNRLPVYTETLDAIEGIIHVRDLLPFLTSHRERWRPLRDLVHPAFFTPESKLLDDLLEELQERRIQMAIVVDEYGGTEGLVTLEDLLEEIVGEIEDEFSTRSREAQVELATNGDLLVDASVPLDYISELLSVPVASDGIDTVGALVYRTLGKIPEVGDELVLDTIQVNVISLFGRRLRRLRITKRP